MTTIDQLRAAVVSEARTWLRTPYHHRACVKGVGVDCGRLLEGVYRNVGFDIEAITVAYSTDWHMHRNTERLIDEGLLRYCHEIDEVDLQAGDILAWRYGRCFSHVGIYLGDGEYVHAHRQSHAVVLGRVDEDEVRDRALRCFSFNWPEAA